MQIHSLFIHSLFARNIAISPVTTVNKAAQHLILKLAALIFHQLNNSLLKCKLFLNLHVYFLFFSPEHHRFVTCHSSEIVERRRIFSSRPISTSDPFLPVILITVVGCQVEGTNGLKFVCVDCVRRMRFIQDLETGQPWNLLT